MITVRQWGWFTSAVYLDDGNPLGGHLLAVVDSREHVDMQQDSGVSTAPEGTRVRDNEEAPERGQARPRRLDPNPDATRK